MKFKGEGGGIGGGGGGGGGGWTEGGWMDGWMDGKEGVWVCGEDELFVFFISLLSGICSGPRKEFWSLLARSLASGQHNLFMPSNNGQLRQGVGKGYHCIWQKCFPIMVG